ncbi:hypothetical protein [Natronorubrum halalkaliphilum]|uniref:hypothetical protein n=1 Tax=Natronorubrum halalkaliphilum TaxID=2691917 RepID=UPI001916692E|nr:hypothetical protein [Natronorubrum halalkaliphilum]
MIGPVRRNIGGNVVAALANFLGGITVLLEVDCEFCEQFRASSVPTVGDSRLASVIEILDSLGDSASKIWNVARWTADRIWNADCKNEVHALLDQNGVTISGSPFTNEGREVLTDLDLDRPSELLLEQWLALIDDLDEKITQLDREIEQVAVSVSEVELLMTVPGISTYSGLLIHAEIGEVERFDRAKRGCELRRIGSSCPRVRRLAD